MYTNIIHNDDICNYFLKNQQFIFNSLGNCRECRIHNYECGSPELISIYNIIRPLQGVYGGRFSGAGFKGAVIALVDPRHKDSVEKALYEQYLAEHPEYAETFKVFWVKPDDGARFIED